MSLIVMEIPSAKTVDVSEFEYSITYHRLPDLRQVFGPRPVVFYHKLAAHAEAKHGWAVRHNHTKLITVIRNHRGEVDNIYYLGEAAFNF